MLFAALACGRSGLDGPKPGSRGREVVAPKEDYAALSSSTLGLFGLGADGQVHRVGSGAHGAVATTELETDLIAAAPEQGRVYTLTTWGLQVTHVASPEGDGGARQVHGLHTTDLQWVGGRLLTLDCNRISEDSLDGGRTTVLDVQSCITSYAFGARGDWVVHETNGVLSATNLAWSKRFEAPGTMCTDFVVTQAYAWCRDFQFADGGPSLVRAALPADSSGQLGPVEIRYRFPEPRSIPLRALGSQVAFHDGKTLVLDGDEGPQRTFEENDWPHAITFEGPDTLVYVVPDAGVVRYGW